jgi:hypothetical protein
VGHPEISPRPTAPAKEIEETLVPQVVPATVTFAVALADETVLLFGVKPAVAVRVAPPSRVKGPLPSDVEKVNCGSEGAPRVSVAGSDPVFVNVIVIGVAGVLGPVVGNAAFAGDPGAMTTAAPAGVATRGTVTLTLLGSFVNRFRDPDRAVPEIDDPGTDAVIVSSPP